MTTEFNETYVSADAAGGGDGTPAQPWTLAEAEANATAGDRVNIQFGRYLLSDSFSPARDGTKTAPIHWRGYLDAPGDAQAPVVVLDGQRGVFSTVVCARDFHRFEFLTAGNTGTAGARGWTIGGHQNTLYRCAASSTGDTGFLVLGAGNALLGCEVERWGQARRSAGYACTVSAWNNTLIGCTARHGEGDGFAFESGYDVGPTYCIAHDCGGYGYVSKRRVESYPPLAVTHCVAHSCAAGGIHSDRQPLLVVNTLLTSCGGFGISVAPTTRSRLTLLATAFHQNQLGEVDPNAVLDEPVPRRTLDRSPYIHAAEGDFRPADSALGVLGAGFPGSFLTDQWLPEWRGYPDIGAVQQAVRPAVNPVGWEADG